MPTAMQNEAADIQKNWGWFLALGIVMAIGGFSAFLAPFLVSLAVEMIVGIFIGVGGIMMLVQVFKTSNDWNARLTYLILGLFNSFAGAMLFFRPLEGMLALTLVLIVAVFVNGLIRIAVGVMARPEPGSAWVIFGGVVSVLASAYLMARYPEISAVLLGILVGVSLIGEGAGFIRLAYGLKNNVSVAI
ncbi:HdeD family acid-resistance protein [Parasedimentitalea psychrophila]|uniref:DUF308 domain-containing protein n=1 Tax=Parasedimentitalea psychrophila TaxID=2997337 RepID=A0A9Y2KX53_9RHOB|nr:DUF308 domain-containing protein [Parasedimentitalea psychrophila]WIY23935.1 DUF308 domain-containing protein [Parasedimentitalea psychrophila]